MNHSASYSFAVACKHKWGPRTSRRLTRIVAYCKAQGFATARKARDFAFTHEVGDFTAARNAHDFEAVSEALQLHNSKRGPVASRQRARPHGFTVASEATRSCELPPECGEIQARRWA